MTVIPITLASPVEQPVALPEFIDDAAIKTPESIWATVPLPAGGSSEYTWVSMTFKSLARAVDSAAWWIKQNVGLGRDGETIGFMA